MEFHLDVWPLNLFRKKYVHLKLFSKNQGTMTALCCPAGSSSLLSAVVSSGRGPCTKTGMLVRAETMHDREEFDRWPCVIISGGHISSLRQNNEGGAAIGGSAVKILTETPLHVSRWKPAHLYHIVPSLKALSLCGGRNLGRLDPTLNDKNRFLSLHKYTLLFMKDPHLYLAPRHHLLVNQESEVIAILNFALLHKHHGLVVVVLHFILLCYDVVVFLTY
jgi:hypothetical protein